MPGSIARAGPNLLITTDVELLRKIAAPRSRYNRSEWNQAMKLDNRIDNILSELDEKRHAELRYKTSFGYNGKDLPSRETRVADRVLDYVKLIEDSYLSTAEHVKPMDLARTAQYFTLDVITDMAFGYPFGFLSANKDLYDYISSVGSLMPFFELQGNVRFVAAITQNYYVKALMSPKANDGSPFGQMIGAAQQAVKERYRPGAEQKEDMLTSFMKRGITQLEAESEALMQVLAGADSTATAVRMIMFHLMSTPYTYQKLQAEIDDAQLTWPVNTDTEAKSLPYLQAVIKEGLRIWPPGVGIATKYVPPEGETLDDGRFIPGGTRIGWSAWGVHHNPETYGEDAKYFRPERWIDNDPDKIRRMENVLDSIFGNGRYGCVGRSLAILELNKILIAVSPLSLCKSFTQTKGKMLM